MAKIDGFDGLCNIEERHILGLVSALSFYAKENLSQVAKKRGWAKGEMLQALAAPLHGITNEYKRAFHFVTPSKKAMTRTGAPASPAIGTYTTTMGLSKDESHDFELTSTATCILNYDLSIPSYALILLSKLGVYNSAKERISNLLTLFCQYAIEHPDEEFSVQDIDKIIATKGNGAYINSRNDIAFNALSISGFISLNENGSFSLNEECLELAQYIAENGESISGPQKGDDDYMGNVNRGILELLTNEMMNIIPLRYKDILKIKLGNDSSDDIQSPQTSSISSRQVIYYGAPGTGKSHGVNDSIKDENAKLRKQAFYDYISTQKKSDGESYSISSIRNYTDNTFGLCNPKISRILIEMFNAKYGTCHNNFFAISNYNQLAELQQSIYGTSLDADSHHTVSSAFKLYLQAIKDFPNLVIRTTFHPDSDYSTFVGAYKPYMEKRPIFNQLDGSKVGEEEKIVYRFVPQAFVQAYETAWKNPDKKVYLIIEEINRGNCAQIFGDLFQLLDRDDNGVSKYPIIADKDIITYLESKDSLGKDHPGIAGGRLCLPANLYIWATMNTSDQSLFPIDSAFKRRWDWEYIPIENHPDENYKIHVKENVYDWWKFLEAINKEVFELTHSEDKQLGYFFVRPRNGIIDADMLVNKVYFYLWNDVFKDYDIEGQKAFKKENNEAIAFKDFFENGLNETLAEQVLINLDLVKENQSAE